MTWAKVKLGEICSIEKGNIGIMKAIPGEFPLVVLGEERRTHNEFQFEGEAVIIPLVSSTGHGHRSMKRIFFQAGKFSIGSILCAVIPKDKTQLSAEFLYRYLDFNKENELVGRMRGMANVTLPMKEIAEVEVPLPPLEIQEQLIEEFQKLEFGKDQISTELDHQLGLVKELRQAYLREAMQGKLVPQDPTDEPAEILLEKIKVEKERLIAEKRIKRDKPLPPINAEETPFEIPSNWTWSKLGAITNFIDYRGKTPNKIQSGIKLITAKNVKFGKFANVPEEFISETDYVKFMTRGIPKNGDILFTTEAPLGNACLLDQSDKFGLAQRIITIQTILFNSEFLLNSILSEVVQKQLMKKATGATAKGIKSSRLVEVLIPLPPLAEQERIVAKLEKLMKFCDELEANIKEGITDADRLLQTALREALEPKAINLNG